MSKIICPIKDKLFSVEFYFVFNKETVFGYVRKHSKLHLTNNNFTPIAVPSTDVSLILNGVISHSLIFPENILIYYSAGRC